MACTSSSPSAQFLCWLDELNIVYTDCEGVVHGDCGMCAGTNNSGTQTNTVAFNPGNNQITTVVDGIASSAILSFDTGDITLASALTINGVLYPAGTVLQTILSAIVAISHPAATVSGGSNPALTINVGSQVLDLDLSAPGSYDNSGSGLVSDNIQDAIGELITVISGLPVGNVGDILMHNGVTFVPVQEVREEFSGFFAPTINLANLPLPFPPVPFRLLRNGVEMDSPDDYTRSGQVVTLTSNPLIWEIFTAYYYI